METDMDLDIQIEHPLLKVPSTHLNNSFRSYTRSLERDVAQASNQFQELSKREQITKREAQESLNQIVVRLKGIKRKLEELNVKEEEGVERCRARLEHLKSAVFDDDNMVTDNDVVSDAKLKEWHQKRIDRLIVDYLLREGYYKTARAIAEDSDIVNLVDLEIFEVVKKIEEDLRSKSCVMALRWCVANKIRLKKIGSDFEFNLRIQEFIELVRSCKFAVAIKHARKFLAPHADESTEKFEKVRRAMATLAFLPNTKRDEYTYLFSDERWQDLVDEFKTESKRLHCLTNKPLLYITLQAGLSSMKTTLCNSEGDRVVDCPVCQPEFSLLAKDLPYPQRTKSSVVCSITKHEMDEDNYAPMVLPNGYIYSKKGLLELAKGKMNIVCPKTKQEYTLYEAKRAFIF